MAATSSLAAPTPSGCSWPPSRVRATALAVHGTPALGEGDSGPYAAQRPPRSEELESSVAGRSRWTGRAHGTPRRRWAPTACAPPESLAGTSKFLLMERPSSRHPFGGHANAGHFDVATREWADVRCATSLENCGHSFLPNGTVVVLAGHKPQGGYPEGRRVSVHTPARTARPSTLARCHKRSAPCIPCVAPGHPRAQRDFQRAGGRGQPAVRPLAGHRHAAPHWPYRRHRRLAAAGGAQQQLAGPGEPTCAALLWPGG